MRFPGPWFLVFLALAAPAVSAESPTALGVQELEGRLADAEKRAASDARERERLTRTLSDLRKKVSSLSGELDLQRRRGEELDRLKGSCEEREDALRGELDLCGRTRQRAEEEKARCSTQLDGVESSHRADLEERDKALEECRGRSADLEAQNLLLAAEKQGAERESRERVDEIGRNYDDLISSLHKDVSDCKESAAERERAESEARARGVEEASQLLERLQQALEGDMKKGTVVLSVSGPRVEAKVILKGLDLPRTAKSKPGGRKTLKTLADALQSSGDRAVIVEGLSAGREDLSNAVRVAAALEREGGLDRQRIAITAAGSGDRGDQRGGAAVLIRIVPQTEFENFFSGTTPPTTE